ncbi:MAG TPA: ABC transporter ATP-binding protein [Mycobacteriales bacterium]|nr:ABC transporter ATP-binding protein [Mycobacteriales bacterium]
MSVPAFRVRGLEKSYRGRGRDSSPVPANRGIDLDIAPAEVFGLLGPNGAGKTTLVRQLVGLARPDAGRIEVFGCDVSADLTLAAAYIGYLAQDEPALLELPVGLAVETTARLRGASRRDAATQTVALLDELSLGPLRDRPLARLSGGQRRLACVAAVLAADRPVLILDEPTTGLDPVARRAVWSALGRRRDERGTTVVLVTHNVLEAELVLDRVAILDRGRVIACDTPGRLKASVSADVRLDLVWRHDPPAGDPTVAELAARADVAGRRWRLRLAQPDARAALGRLTAGPAFAALDDFTLATPTLEDVYLQLGGSAHDLERE